MTTMTMPWPTNPMDRAVLDPNLSHMEYRLLTLIVSLGSTKPCVERLARDMPGSASRKGVSERTIRRGLSRLQELGYIEITEVGT